MRYIWKNRQGPMHIQATDFAGRPLNASVCGLVFDKYKTINPPFTLGKGECKHCCAVVAGTRSQTVPAGKE